MKSNAYTAFFLLLSFLVFLSSCADESQDMESPTIQILESSPELSSVELCGQIEDRVFDLKDGDELFVRMLIEDNEQIAEVKWDIHNNFDCHGHGGGSAPGFTPPQVGQLTEDWAFLRVDEVNASTHEISEGLKVPERVTAGNYHFGLQAVDQSGNTTPFGDVFSIRVYNPDDTIAPEIVINKPESRNLTADRSDVLQFSGTLTDNRDLGQGGNSLVFLTYRRANNTNAFTGPFAVVPAEHGTAFSFDIEWKIPSTLTTGDYIVNIQGHDGVRNTAPFEVFSLSIVN